jgi:hypothetical protein
MGFDAATGELLWQQERVRKWYKCIVVAEFYFYFFSRILPVQNNGKHIVMEECNKAAQ